MIIFNVHPGTRFAYDIALTKLDENRVLVTMFPIGRRADTCNGSPVYRSVVIHRAELTDEPQTKAALWDRCGCLGAREDNSFIVPAVCEILGAVNPGIFMMRR